MSAVDVVVGMMSALARLETVGYDAVRRVCVYHERYCAS